MNIKRNKELLEEGILNIRKTYGEYIENRKTGKFLLVFNCFEGGITVTEIIKKETSK